MALLSQEPLRESLDILTSVEYSRCELQPRPSRIPVRREPPLTETSSLRVWKLLKPGVEKHPAGQSRSFHPGSYLRHTFQASE
ncbi:cytosolic carboxypeptidase-like protein 5 isoform X2 [Sinocyclocheilus grahami]|uniref:cytosolic carboxypeptidase-like protein 5 isoform X2 n=1 Tax=Sinocyclocheilus grahami TaxID=75366 RepID=UPI0007ACCDA2|nr:PREDICTED: cytosolic carboxypeptidase-like protein 5 isoform X2 [Sinocyclocheilus grahami]